jgi:RNA polymerase sigma-70 factor (ECF subfamily)
MTETDTDEALLMRYGRGDLAAGRVLTRRLAPRLLALAGRMLDAAEAEDITQETLLRLWRIAPHWEPGGAQPGTWAWRVALNLVNDRLRRRRGGSASLDEIPEPEDETPDVLRAMMTRERADALRVALADLPDRQREAVVLRHLEGLSNPEIARLLGTGVEAVESLIARGKRALVNRLAPRRSELGLDR